MTSIRGDFEVEYDGGTPPLPKLLRRDKNSEISLARHKDLKGYLPAGCYLIRFTPLVTVRNRAALRMRPFLGVFRVEHGDELPLDPIDDPEDRYQLWVRGSADLYGASRIVFPDGTSVIGEEDAESGGDEEAQDLEESFRALREKLSSLGPPTFPTEDHRFYCRMSNAWVYTDDHRLRLQLEPYCYETLDGRWQPRMAISFDIPGPPSDADPEGGYFELEVRNQRNTIVGKMDLARVSESFRSASVRLFGLGVALSEPVRSELISGAREQFSDSGIALSFATGELPSSDAIEAIELPADSVWTRSTLLKALGNLRADRTRRENGLREWRDRWEYWVLVVPEMTDESGVHETVFGLMFDDAAAGGNARRACAVQLKAFSPNTAGLAETVAHELGHCFGLYHDLFRNGLMKPNPTEIDGGHFSLRDKARLKHLPDTWVRPDGIAFAHRYTRSPVELLDLAPKTEGLTLTVESVFFQRDGGEGFKVDFEVESGEGEVDLPEPSAVERGEPQHLVSCTVIDPSGKEYVLGSRELPWFRDPTLKTTSKQHYSVDLRQPGVRFRTRGWYQVNVGMAWVVDENRLQRVQGKGFFLGPAV